MMELNFKIERPESDLNWATLIVKYITLFILGLVVLWILGLSTPFWRRNRYNDNRDAVVNSMANSPYVWTIFFGLLIIGIFIYRAYRKYKLGEVFEINFIDSEGFMETKAVNLLNNNLKTKRIPYDHLTFIYTEQENPLFGLQRTIEIFDHTEKAHVISIDRTAWARHDNINAIIERIKNWAQQRTEIKNNSFPH